MSREPGNGLEVQPKVADTRQGAVEYAEYGDGPAVIALHGAMGGWDQSLLLGRTIGSDGYRYIGVSRPGYLGTPMASGKAVEQQADLCAALMDELGIDKAVVMAVSGGGPCAIHFALRHPDRCSALVLVSTCGEKVDTPIPFSFKLMTRLIRIPALARSIERKAREKRDAAIERSIPDQRMREQTLADPVAGPLFLELIASTSFRMADRISGTLNDIDITRTCDYDLEGIDVPTLIIHGTDDPMLPYEKHAKALQSRIPNAELITAENGVHASIFTHRSLVQPKVAAFLQEHTDHA